VCTWHFEGPLSDASARFRHVIQPNLISRENYCNSSTLHFHVDHFEVNSELQSAVGLHILSSCNVDCQEQPTTIATIDYLDNPE
jgi:hypothetical protein